MLIPFGVLSAAGAGVVGGDYELIASEILTSSETSVTFSSLGDYSSTYKHLQLRAVIRDDRATGLNFTLLRINADTGSNYSQHLLSGDGSSVSSSGNSSQTSIQHILSASNSSTSNAFSTSVIDILDAYSSTKNKTVRILGGFADGANSRIRLGSGAWLNTASITTISITDGESQSFVSGSRFSLYGIKG